MRYSALVPVKALSRAKSRLASYLTPQQRASLVLEMLSHVVHTLCESELFEQVYIVSADATVLELAQFWGAEALPERQHGHNPALQAAATTIVERTIWRHGTSPLRDNMGLLTISADLPFLTQRDIRELLTYAEQFQIVLVGSRDGTGTNAILMRPPLALPYLFGPNSLPAYRQAAQTRELGLCQVNNLNIAFDIDTFDDVQELEHSTFQSIHMPDDREIPNQRSARRA